jgi:GDP-D-mannose dehydratase
VSQNRVALITGVTRQDGSYLARLLLNRGYAAHDIKRSSSLFRADRIDHLYQSPHVTGRTFVLRLDDTADSTSFVRIVPPVLPDEIYSLTAQSQAAVSFDEPEWTANSDALGDWGHATDYVEKPLPILQQEKTEHFHIATGVCQFVQFAAPELGIAVRLEGECEMGVIEAVTGSRAQCEVGNLIVTVNPRNPLPIGVENLLGDTTKVQEQLPWTPKTTLEELAQEIVEVDYTATKRDEMAKKAGFATYDHHE